MVKMLAAIATPYRPDGGVDLDAFQAHLDWLVEAGLDGVFVAGTTGEGVLRLAVPSRTPTHVWNDLAHAAVTSRAYVRAREGRGHSSTARPGPASS